MAIKRYFASKDNTITNAFKPDLSTRATSSNMGLSDVSEIFSIYGQASSSSGLSSEEARVLISFPTTTMATDRTSGTIPASGSVSFYLKMFNADHGQTLPQNYYMEVKAVTGSDSYPREWEEGYGLDMESYSDSTQDITGSNWTNISGSSAWTTAGGDYINPDTDLSSSFTQYFDDGTENLEVDVTTLVEQWLSSSANSETAVNMGLKQNYGVGVMLSSSHTTESRSFYTKKLFARGSEFYFKRPVLEARWDSRKRDNRGNFIYSSSLATPDENLNKIYLYNYFRGQLRNIPDVGTGNIYISFYSGSANDSAPYGSALELVVDSTHVTDAARNTVVTGSYSTTGIYTGSVSLTGASTPLTTIYDVWFKGGDTITNASDALVRYHTGSIKPKTLDSYDVAPSDKYVTSITNLKSVYSNTETARFRVFARTKDWSPTIYTVATTVVESTEIESGSYKVFRVIDELDVIPYGTGSDLHTAMSYDLSGNYFDLDMSTLQVDYMYGVKFTYYNNSIGDWVEQPEVFKFRVEK
jgi:hypothetical protein